MLNPLSLPMKCFGAVMYASRQIVSFLNNGLRCHRSGWRRTAFILMTWLAVWVWILAVSLSINWLGSLVREGIRSLSYFLAR